MSRSTSKLQCCSQGERKGHGFLFSLDRFALFPDATVSAEEKIMFPSCLLDSGVV